jgi:hypothetical protein
MEPVWIIPPQASLSPVLSPRPASLVLGASQMISSLPVTVVAHVVDGPASDEEPLANAPPKLHDLDLPTQRSLKTKLETHLHADTTAMAHITEVEEAGTDMAEEPTGVLTHMVAQALST